MSAHEIHTYNISTLNNYNDFLRAWSKNDLSFTWQLFLLYFI